jgi:hypothetical protein
MVLLPVLPECLLLDLYGCCCIASIIDGIAQTVAVRADSFCAHAITAAVALVTTGA